MLNNKREDKGRKRRGVKECERETKKKEEDGKEKGREERRRYGRNCPPFINL